MALDDVSPFAAYTVSGIGPYAVNWPYLAGSVQVSIEQDGARTVLEAGTTLDPAGPADAGNVFLDPDTALANAGARLVIERRTPDEQGWMGVLGPREAGLEAQLDRMVKTDQELRGGLRGALRVAGDLDPLVAVPGRVVGFGDDGQPVSGPAFTAIAAAQQNAVIADAAAALAVSARDQAEGHETAAGNAADAAVAAAASATADADQVEASRAEVAANTASVAADRLVVDSAALQVAEDAAAAGTARDEAQAAASAAEVAKITWRGPWLTGTFYVLRDAVERNGASYITKSAHTSGAASEPGGGVDWPDFWDVLALKGEQGDDGPTGPGSGDVEGPASAVNNRLAVFDGSTGKRIKDGGVAVDGLATAAQGAKADSAFQPGDILPLADVEGLSDALAERLTQPFANRAAAVAAIPSLPASVTRIAWYDGTALLEVVKAGGAGLLPQMDDWVPVAPHRVQHWGIVVHTTASAARAAVAAMSGGERTAHQAALASAFGAAVGRLVLDGWAEATDHIIINPYRVIDMSVPVDQAGITVASARFNLSAEAIVSGGTSVRGCIIEKLHIACEQDAVGASADRADVVAYPPAFIPRGDFGRCEYLRIANAFEGIGEVAGGANNGGWTFGRAEISSYGRPFNFDGDLHHVTVSDTIDVWVYGMNANQQAVARDGATPAARIGRVDTFVASAITAYRICDVEIDAGTNSIPIMISSLALDGDGGGLRLTSGNSLIGLSYGTEAGTAPQLDHKILCEGGSHVITGLDYVGDALKAVHVTAGDLTLISPKLYHLNNAVGRLAMVEGTGSLTLVSPRLRWANSARTFPAIDQSGANAVLRVLDPIIDPGITVATNAIRFQNDNAANVLRADTIAPHAAVFTPSWTLGWYRASGVTSPRSRLQDSLVIDNGAADGGNITLRSQGNPSWEIDNLSGQLRMVRGGIARIGVTDTNMTVNLQIAGTAVTQSDVDTTTGRLAAMRPNGIFGLGSTLGAPTCPDLDSFALAAGIYQVTSSVPNIASRPVGSSSFATVKVHRYDNTRIWQEYYDRLDSGPTGLRKWIRGSGAGPVWGPWQRDFTSGSVVGPVTQAGGIATGAVVQRGSTANGHFTKFADGTMECWHTQNSSAGGAATWTFPTDVPFVGDVNVQVTPQATVLRIAVAATTGTPTLTAAFQCFDGAGALTVTGCNLVAKGRWF